MADEPMTHADAIARLKELVEDIDFTMLHHAGSGRQPRPRPMSTRQMDENGDIWFFTAEDTKKVDEVEAGSRHGPCLPRLEGHAVRVGRGPRTRRARRAQDGGALHRRRSTSGSRTDSGLRASRCLKVTPVEAEFWEPKHGKLVMAAGMLKALVTKDTPDDTMRNEQISCDAAARGVCSAPAELRDRLRDRTSVSRSPVRRSHSSTSPCAAPRPTITIFGHADQLGVAELDPGRHLRPIVVKHVETAASRSADSFCCDLETPRHPARWRRRARRTARRTRAR
jgi:hypothetical protein